MFALRPNARNVFRGGVLVNFAVLAAAGMELCVTSVDIWHRRFFSNVPLDAFHAQLLLSVGCCSCRRNWVTGGVIGCMEELAQFTL